MLQLTLGHMMPELTTWVGLIAFPTVGFSLAFTILLPGKIQYDSVSTWPFLLPVWGLLGEFDLEAVDSSAPDPTRSSTAAPCAFPRCTAETIAETMCTVCGAGSRPSSRTRSSATRGSEGRTWCTATPCTLHQVHCADP